MRKITLIARTIIAFSIILGSSPALGQEWAKKMFKVTKHDFGTVARGAKSEFRFEFENLYEEDLHVAGVRSSCGCTSPVIAQRDLKTFDKSYILTKYNTRSFLGQRGATVTVIFDKPYYAEVQLNVSGYIRSDVVFDPGEINFGEVAQFESAEKSLKLNYAGRADWKVKDVRSASDHFQVQLKETSRGRGSVGYEMLVRLKGSAPAGHFQDQITIVTDDQRLKTIPLLVQGNVISPLTVSPSSLFLGVVKPGQSVTKKLVVRGKEKFKILSVKCEDGCFKFKPLTDEEKPLHFVSVTFTADSAGKIAEKIMIETNLGEGAIAACTATATVRSATVAE